MFLIVHYKFKMCICWRMELDTRVWFDSVHWRW